MKRSMLYTIQVTSNQHPAKYVLEGIEAAHAWHAFTYTDPVQQF